MKSSIHLYFALSQGYNPWLKLSWGLSRPALRYPLGLVLPRACGWIEDFRSSVTALLPYPTNSRLLVKPRPSRGNPPPVLPLSPGPGAHLAPLFSSPPILFTSLLSRSVSSCRRHEPLRGTHARSARSAAAVSRLCGSNCSPVPLFPPSFLCFPFYSLSRGLRPFSGALCE